MVKKPSIFALIAGLFVISVPLNFVWELAQMPLYVEGGNLLDFARHCIIPSLGDGVIVLVGVALRRLVCSPGHRRLRPDAGERTNHRHPH